MGFCLPGAALDRDAFTFTRYDLDVRLEPQQQRLQVRGKIVLRNDSASAQKTAVLQLSSTLAWRTIRLHDKSLDFVAQSYASDLDHTGALSEAVVTLPKEIPPGGSFELEIGYEGTVPLSTTRLTHIGAPDDIARHSDWDRVGTAYTALRGIGYVAWYPVGLDAVSLADANSVFEAVANWKSRHARSSMRVNLCISAPESATVTALMNDSPSAQSTSTAASADRDADCAEHSFDPLGLTVPTILAAPYVRLDQPPARLYYLPSHESEAKTNSLSMQLAAPFVAEWLGSPHAVAQIVELPDADAIPFEAGSLLVTPLAASADSRQVQLVAVHQLAHASFSSQRPWINEGLAHFLQAAFIERRDGRQAALDFMALRQPGLLDAEKKAPTYKPEAAARESLINTASEDLYRTKAMYVFWMLRDIIGEDSLKKALAAYRPDEDREPSYLQRLMESQSHKDLEWFFDDWVYRDQGLPDFRVESVYTRQNMKGGYLVTVTLENLGSAGAEVPVSVSFEGGDVPRRVEIRAHAKSVFRVDLSSPPTEVSINNGSVPESDLQNNVYRVEPPGK